MLRLKNLALTLAVLNGIAIFVFLTSSGILQSKEEPYLQEQIESKFFYNKTLGAELLDLLEKYEVMPLHYYNVGRTPSKEIGKVYLGVKHDPDYCKKVRHAVAEDPDVFFNELNFLTDDLPDTLIREKIIPRLGRDTLPNTTYAKIPKANSTVPRWFMDPKTTMYYIHAIMHYYHELGKEIGCLFQGYNHVAGMATLFRKDLIARSAVNYTYKYKDKPQCFDHTKFFPKTLSLDNKTECLEFFDYIKSEEYQQEKEERSIVFIRKISVGSHQGKGVQPVDEEEEKNLTAEYGGGKLCGKNMKSVIVQRYIHNPLLVKNHKFDFRIYMMVASVNPMIVYYHDGFLRVSLFEYDVTKNEKAMHLTNTAQSRLAMKKAMEGGAKNQTELEDFQFWNLTRFTDYLVEIGKIEDRSWLDNYLRPQFQHAMQHLIRMTQNTFYPISSSWKLLGIDFMLDEDLKLWFIEANVGPELKGSPKAKEIMMTRMVYDMFEIVTAYLKSRLKRAIKYINWLERSGQISYGDNGEVIVQKLAQRQHEYSEITKNYLDEEFEISADNTWIKIIDDNIDGLDRYNGMFNIECFDLS